jgi:hypothetical protein
VFSLHASYTISLGALRNVSIEFGPDVNYPLTAWTQPALVGGELVSLFVAE